MNCPKCSGKEIDEMWHFMRKKTKKYRTFKTIDRNDQELLAYECDDRTIRTISRPYEQLEKLKIGHFYNDNREGFSAA